MNKFCQFHGLLAVVFLCLFLTVPASAVNILSVQDPQQYGSAPGFINDATLVVEPHGGYVEQSLYLSYSDHGQYPAGRQIEIVHRFELPPGSVINDLWLWIADSVMQAIMMDTWTARAIYDSIVSHKRDPAFLTKIGEQYELHVYPLTPGSFRKVKMNFITPTRWLGEQASATLPLPLLQANNAATKPLDVLFRAQEGVWGQPAIAEFPDRTFRVLKDTLNYRYKTCYIPDLSQAQALTLTFATNFLDGFFYKCYKKPNALSYFQLGIMPRLFFDLSADTSRHRFLVGLDLSGTLEDDLPALLPNLRNTLSAAMKPNDQFKLVAVGGGRIQKYLQEWMPGDSAIVRAVLQEFQQSDLGRTLQELHKPHILYCDPHAAQCWRFPGLEELATFEIQNSIQSSTDFFSSADVIAAYEHGMENILDNTQLAKVTAALDSFFTSGGRLLSFYDYNRVGKEKLASYFITGLTTSRRYKGMLYRNPDGNFGKNFPESVYHPVVNFLEYDDAGVRVELMDGEGNAAVISKKVKNGLLVVSGIWAFSDDSALRAMLGIPLLGLNPQSKYQQLPQLLGEIKSIHQGSSFDRAIIVSNSDSLFQPAAATTWAKTYLQDFNTGIPIIHTVALLQGKYSKPPSVTVDHIEYYGSGYLLKELSDQSNGLHFERHTDDWAYMAASLSPNSVPLRQQLDLDVIMDGGIGQRIETREVDPKPNDPNKPIFFIGSGRGQNAFEFDFHAKFQGRDSTINKKIDVPIITDSLASGKIIPAMLAFEKLRDLLSTAGWDTAAIVQLAIENNLLCDYTALLCLEPNDTLHYLRNPLIEDGFLSAVEEEEQAADSLKLEVFPNPFNERTQISINLPKPSETTVSIYNIRGQLVKEVVCSEMLVGRKSFFWDGMSSTGQPVSSGVYFVQVTVRPEKIGQLRSLLGRILLLR